MANVKFRKLTADPTGLAMWMERESQTMHPLQFYREAVQNEFEAGADKVIIDGFNSKQGLLARVSGNGTGMSWARLVTHLATVMKTDKGANNHGVGARIAALPANPAGVTFASRIANGDEGMIALVKQGDDFAMKSWPVMDADGGTVFEEVIAPNHGELANVKNTGTAVILHGNGRTPTWDNSIAHRVHNYLARRYFHFRGKAIVTIAHAEDKKRIVAPFGEILAKWALSDGEVQFAGIGGLSGTMFWWVLPNNEDMKIKVPGRNDIGSGIGLVVEDEIFEYSQAHMTDFGILYRTVQSRVVILIAVSGAKMDTSRSTIVYPMGRTDYKRTTPWKALGRCFSEHMPPEIDELMTKVMPSSSIFTEDAAKKIDAEWMKWIKPVPVLVQKKNAALTIGDEPGDALPPDKTCHNVDPLPQPPPPPLPPVQVAAHRETGGDKIGGVTKLKTVTPQVKFVVAEQMPEDHPHIFWAETSNTVMISEQFPPYVREIKRWIEKTDHPKSLVEIAVQNAYSIEYAAYIIDANAQRGARLIPDEIEALKTDLSLYGKALGCQSLTAMIESYLKIAVKAA